jgi:hypothetical protein
VVLTLMVATRGMRASERKRRMKSWCTVSYTGSVVRYKRVIRAQVTKLFTPYSNPSTRYNVPGTRTVL